MNHPTDPILQAMNAAGVSQRQLADRLKLSEARVSQILANRNPTLRTLEKIAKALDMRLIISFQR